MKSFLHHKRLLLIFFGFFFCDQNAHPAQSLSNGNEAHFYFPFSLSLYQNLALPTPAQNFSTSLSLGVFRTQYNNLYGIGISALSQQSAGDVFGMQISPINLSNGSVFGAQIGLYNQVEESLNGFQIGLANVSDSFNGVQIGLFNHSRNGHGLQIGLINYDEEQEGATFGPINIVKHGIFRIGTLYSLQNQLAIQPEFGGRIIYTLVRYKYDFVSRIFNYYLGIGSQIPLLSERIYFYPQFFMSGFGSPLHEYGLTTKVGFLFNPSFEVISGIDSALNLNVDNGNGGFSHEARYKFDAFLGLQINFTKSPLSFLF